MRLKMPPNKRMQTDLNKRYALGSAAERSVSAHE